MQSTFSKEIADTLAPNLSGLESASLRLDKLTFLGGNSKKEQIEAVCRIAATHSTVPPALPADVTFTLKLGARMMVNMAGGVLENAGLCLHRHYNCPVIPGSALKGIARHAAWCEWKQLAEAGKTAEATDQAEAIADVFGFPTGDNALDDALGGRSKRDANAGSIAFLPAWTVGAAPLGIDIVNCHHPHYYQDKDGDMEAYDTENPVPNFFIAVESGALFRFALRHSNRQCHGDMETRLSVAEKYLRRALKDTGAGAKTAAGYGWFMDDPGAAAAELAEAEQQAQIAQKAHQERQLAAMPPFEKAMLEIQKLKEDEFNTYADTFSERTLDEKRAYIKLLQTQKMEYWKSICKRLRKQPKPTLVARHTAILNACKEINEVLP